MKIVMTVLASILISGCSGFLITDKPSVCDDMKPEDSVICQVLPRPETDGVLLQMANLAMLDGNVYTTEQAMSVVNGIRAFMRVTREINPEDLTYGALTDYTKGRVGLYLSLLSDFLPEFEKPDISVLVIKDADFRMILKHLDDQERIIKARGHITK